MHYPSPRLDACKLALHFHIRDDWITQLETPRLIINLARRVTAGLLCSIAEKLPTLNHNQKFTGRATAAVTFTHLLFREIHFLVRLRNEAGMVELVCCASFCFPTSSCFYFARPDFRNFNSLCFFLQDLDVSVQYTCFCACIYM